MPFRGMALCAVICAVVCATASGCGGTVAADVSSSENSAASGTSSEASSQEVISAEDVGETTTTTAVSEDTAVTASSETSETVTESKASEPETDPTQGGKYDSIVVNEGVDRAVAAGNTEPVYVNGSYSFTWSGLGNVYSNEELAKCFDRLQSICNNANFRLAFSYKNLDTGAYVGYKQYDSFMTCSTIKAPYVKSILANDIDLARIIRRDTYWQWDVPGDPADLVASAAYGTEYTAKQLIEYTILRSDNSAYYLLFKTFGYWGFNSNQYAIGSNYTLGDSWIFTYCSTDDMMRNYSDIYSFGEENDKGRWLIDLLSDTDLNIQIGQALGAKYKVAQKYGSEFNENVFNDCAIVYADSPFVLCIFTEQHPETEESCKVFKELAVVFDDINTLLADA